MAQCTKTWRIARLRWIMHQWQTSRHGWGRLAGLCTCLQSCPAVPWLQCSPVTILCCLMLRMECECQLLVLALRWQLWQDLGLIFSCGFSFVAFLLGMALIHMSSFLAKLPWWKKCTQAEKAPWKVFNVKIVCVWMCEVLPWAASHMHTNTHTRQQQWMAV